MLRARTRINTPITIVVRRSRTDRGTIPWTNPYRTAGLHATALLPSSPTTANELLTAVLALLPASPQLLALHPEAADPSWWQVATATRESLELALWTPQDWRRFSAGKGKNGLKLFLLPRVELVFPLPPVPAGLPPVAAGLPELPLPLVPHVLPPQLPQPPPPPPQLHPRITEALDHAQYLPSAQIISLLGTRSIHVAVSHYLGTPIAALVLSPILSSVLTACARATGVIVVTDSRALAEHVAQQLREFLSGTMATVGVGVGGPDAVVVVARTELRGVLACAQVVVFGSVEVGVAAGVVLTRVTGTRGAGWEVADAPTHMAEVQRMLAVGGPVEGVLGVCSRLPDGVVLVVAPGDVLQELADLYGAVWLAHGVPLGSVRMLLVGLEEGVVEEGLGWSVQLVAGVVVVDEDEDEEGVVDVVAEMVGEMGIVVVVS